jgi:hypothetical protein
VIRRRIRFTETAQGHIRRESSWWLENRDHKAIFASELEAILEIVARLPGAGRLYGEAGIPGLRRLYLSRIACHIYYTFDEAEVIFPVNADGFIRGRLLQCARHGKP